MTEYVEGKVSYMYGKDVRGSGSVTDGVVELDEGNIRERVVRFITFKECREMRVN